MIRFKFRNRVASFLILLNMHLFATTFEQNGVKDGNILLSLNLISTQNDKDAEDKYIINTKVGYFFSDDLEIYLGVNTNSTYKHTQFVLSPGINYYFYNTLVLTPYIGFQYYYQNTTNEFIESQEGNTYYLGTHVFLNENVALTPEFGVNYLDFKEQEKYLFYYLFKLLFLGEEMKNSIILLSSLLLIVGCGVFNKKNINDEKLLKDNERVDLTDPSGTYDLADYLFPKENHIYEYEITTESKRNEEVSDSYVVNRQNDYSIDGQLITLNEDITYSISNLIISKVQLFNNFKKESKFRRNLDINDTYESFEQINIQKNYFQIGMLYCQLKGHLESMELLNKKYTDVIHLTCFGDFEESSIDFKETRVFRIDGFYAKNIGRINEVLQERQVNTYGNTQDNIQSNETTILKTILQ